MKKMGFKLIFTLGICTLLFLAYVLTFYFVLNQVVRPFERTNQFKKHPLRPIYNVAYYPMRKFIANGSSFKSERMEEYYGTLKRPYVIARPEKRHRWLRIETPEQSDILIGFTGNISILRKFDDIEYESYVRVVFGTALTEEHDRFINRLISVEVIELMDDPRIEDNEYSDDKRRAIESRYDNLADKDQICAKKFVSEYKDRVLEHCLQAGYARNIGGGCFHLMPYSVTTAVLDEALNLCSK